MDHDEVSRAEPVPVLEYATPVEIEVGNAPATASAILGWYVPAAVMAGVASLSADVAPILGGLLLSGCIVAAPLAIILGHIGRARSRKLNGRGRWLALQGMALGYAIVAYVVVAMLMSIAWPT
jgi:hypothetical protein